MSVDDIPTAWIRRIEQEHPKDDDPDLDASAKLEELIHDQPEVAFTVIDKIIGSTENQKVVGNAGAGPLEDLLRLHGPAIVDRVLERARQDTTWRLALGVVWTSSFHDKQVAA